MKKSILCALLMSYHLCVVSLSAAAPMTVQQPSSALQQPQVHQGTPIAKILVPTILSISPIAARPGETVTILGKDLPLDYSQNQVWFTIGKEANGKLITAQAKILRTYQTSSGIVYDVQVPNAPGAWDIFPGKVTMQPFGVQTNSYNFEFRPYPVCSVTSSWPAVAESDALITFQGSNLNADCEFFLYRSGTYNAAVLVQPATPSSVVVRVPQIAPGSATITAKRKNNTVYSTSNLTFKVSPTPPIISSLDKAVFNIGDNIKISGSGFDNNSEVNFIINGLNSIAEIVSKAGSVIVVKSPNKAITQPVAVQVYVTNKQPAVPGGVQKSGSKSFTLRPLAASGPKMTPLDPKQQGLRFSNTFHNDFVPALNVVTGGLCGGMSYAVLDYYYAKKPIPAQDYRPANRTALQSYLYNRQVDSITSNLDRWAEFGFNPGGVRNSEFFKWGLEGKPGGRIDELKSFIDRGVPVPLGLQGASNRSGSHYVIAIGYEMGRYQGDLGANQGDFKIFILDPNHPAVTKTLIPDLTAQVWRLADDQSSGWQGYFVDKKYGPKPPPAIVNPIYPNDGKVYELLLSFETGGDDLRGGNDNVDVFVNLYDGTQQIYRNVNLGGRWLDKYLETVRLVMTAPVAPSLIKELVISTTFGGGISGDNWDMKSLDVRALCGGLDKNLKKAGFYRFTGQAKQLIVPISPKPATPAGYIDQLELKFATGDDDLRGGNDNVNVLVSLKDGTTQAFENVNNSNRWADRTSSTVKLDLNRAVPPALLMTITISTTFGGGFSGDNWNMNSVQVRAIGTGVNKAAASYGAKRFTGSDKVLVLPCVP